MWMREAGANPPALVSRKLLSASLTHLANLLHLVIYSEKDQRQKNIKANFSFIRLSLKATEN